MQCRMDKKQYITYYIQPMKAPMTHSNIITGNYPHKYKGKSNMRNREKKHCSQIRQKSKSNCGQRKTPTMSTKQAENIKDHN